MAKSANTLSPGDRMFGVDKEHNLISEVVKIIPSVDGNKDNDIIVFKLFSINSVFNLNRGNVKQLVKKGKANYLNSVIEDLRNRETMEKTYFGPFKHGRPKLNPLI